MTSSIDILNRFEGIGLEHMQGVTLMNRTDTKFVFKLSALEQILEKLVHDYFIVEIEGSRLCKYETQYYDTQNLDLYLQHHAGKLNRFKIRHRIYHQSAIGYLEIKFKNNKGRTIKTRTKCTDAPKGWTEGQQTFLTTHQPYAPSDLRPSIRIDYNRITLVNKTGKERVTLDLKLSFIADAAQKSYDQLVIAEVKQNRRLESAFLKSMKLHRVREGSISKYCMGIAETGLAIKKNNFKEKLRKINSTKL